jgi:hypothetical protein
MSSDLGDESNSDTEYGHYEINYDNIQLSICIGFWFGNMLIKEINKILKEQLKLTISDDNLLDIYVIYNKNIQFNELPKEDNNFYVNISEEFFDRSVYDFCFYEPKIVNASRSVQEYYMDTFIPNLNETKYNNIIVSFLDGHTNKNKNKQIKYIIGRYGVVSSTNDKVEYGINVEYQEKFHPYNNTHTTYTLSMLPSPYKELIKYYRKST